MHEAHAQEPLQELFPTYHDPHEYESHYEEMHEFLPHFEAPMHHETPHALLHKYDDAHDITPVPFHEHAVLKAVNP